jgi:uncharacterized protein YsxB (DUF464 family)
MIKALFCKSANGFTGFEITGHSGYSEEGSDIVCACVSSLTELTLRTLDAFRIKYGLESDAEKPRVRVNIAPDGDSEKIISSFYGCLNDYAAEYGDYLSVVVTKN